MNYKADEYDIWDLDCFFLDKSQNIIHFASSGSPIPLSISNWDEDNIILKNYIDSLPEIVTKLTFNPELRKLEKLFSEKRFKEYVVSFESVAKKGIISFNKTGFDHHATNYHLVCRPTHLLNLNKLPVQIQQTLKRTQYPEELKLATSFNMGKLKE